MHRSSKSFFELTALRLRRTWWKQFEHGWFLNYLRVLLVNPSLSSVDIAGPPTDVLKGVRVSIDRRGAKAGAPARLSELRAKFEVLVCVDFFADFIEPNQRRFGRLQKKDYMS